jgi:formate hydrogenlyase subunit 3/multisubunit Na+/H+ antiporter MnhD subunit
MSDMTAIIAIPIIAGIVTLIIPRMLKGVKEFVSLAVGGYTLFAAVKLFLARPLTFSIDYIPLLKVDALSGFIVIFIAAFGLLGIIYSIGFMKDKEKLNQYYGCVLMTIGASIGAAIASNLILFLACWGFLGVTLYILMNLGSPDPSAASKKTLIIIGGADALMILGVGIIWQMKRSFAMTGMPIALNNGMAVLAYLSLACGAFAKAGVMPFHTWIPTSSEVTPSSVMGLIPASLDKLLGIYFMARLSLFIFDIRTSLMVSNILLVIGTVTILAGVMMALTQHNFKKLLAYHAVSQVGYMVVGIGTGNPVGVAGGLFHMLNNAIFKYGLFLSAGAVESKKGTVELDDLGGLSKMMPVTYVCTLIAALAISGVPPLNGFVSKWMVYQGLVEFGREAGGRMWVLWLTAAIFGSALTLASFMKIIHATFLGQCRGEECKRDEVGFSMWMPMAVLALLCVVFGVFAYQIPIKIFIQPSVFGKIIYPGLWDASLSTGLILIGIVIGAVIYAIGNVKNLRINEPFIGGEQLRSDMKISGVSFYKTIEDIPLIAKFYNWAKKGYFDIYDQGSNAVFFFTRAFQKLHNGVLPTYLAWCLVGAVALFFILR